MLYTKVWWKPIILTLRDFSVCLIMQTFTINYDDCKVIGLEILFSNQIWPFITIKSKHLLHIYRCTPFVVMLLGAIDLAFHVDNFYFHHFALEFSNHEIFFYHIIITIESVRVENYSVFFKLLIKFELDFPSVSCNYSLSIKNYSIRLHRLVFFL